MNKNSNIDPEMMLAAIVTFYKSLYRNWIGTTVEHFVRQLLPMDRIEVICKQAEFTVIWSNIEQLSQLG